MYFEGVGALKGEGAPALRRESEANRPSFWDGFDEFAGGQTREFTIDISMADDYCALNVMNHGMSYGVGVRLAGREGGQ